jgi:biopolymer transport protein ExbD
MNFRGKHRSQELGFQIAPMIDIIFNLLAFFVATQIFSQWETEIDIKLPTADTGNIPQRLPGEVIINIRYDGTIVVNQQILDDAGLENLLGRVVKLFPGQPVLIRADKTTAYLHVVKVLDLCRQSDIWNISSATMAAEESPPAAAAPAVR